MAGSEADWVTVANNLLLKCHIHLRIRELEDCDANVFIALYQSILGEKVPGKGTKKLGVIVSVSEAGSFRCF